MSQWLVNETIMPPTIYIIIMIITYLGPQKRIFFWSYGFDYFFGSLRRCILYRQMWPYMFFFNISVRLFFNKMLKNYGFAMPLALEPRPYMAIFAHIWPYMTNLFGHPESTASIRFDHFFLVITSNCGHWRDFFVFVVWPKRLKKTRLRGYRYIYFINTDPWPFHYHFHSSLPASVTSTFCLAKTFCDPKAGQNRSQNSTKAAK